MTIVREIGYDSELMQLTAEPVSELIGLRGARIDSRNISPGKSPKVLVPQESLVVASGSLARSADFELNFTLPTSDWQTSVAVLDGSATITLSSNMSAPRMVLLALPGMVTPFELVLKPQESTISVRVLVDKVIAEFFVQGGRAAGTFGLKAGVSANNATISVVAHKGHVALTSVAAWAMGCGWV